ncbi:hypothetical protein JCM6882_004395 [Rhodosporidiobolus microsporus]
MMPAPAPPTNGVAKPPRLKIDKKYGGTNAAAKYKSKSDFCIMHRTFWWLQGYDLKVGFESQTECRLTCATHGSCQYNCVGEFTHFPEMNAAGYRINPDGFKPEHNHPAPYVPMDAAKENARRAKLSHGDPSLENPPLERAAVVAAAGSDASSSGGRDGFARAGSAATSVQGGAGGGGGGYVPPAGQQQQQQGSFGSPTMGQAQSFASASQGGAAAGPSSSVNGPYATPQPQQQQQHQARASFPPTQQGSMPPPQMPYQQQQPTYGAQQQQPAPMYGYQQPLHTPGSSTTFGTPVPPPSASSSFVHGGLAPTAATNAAHAHLRGTPLGSFLLSISPSFAAHLPLFEANPDIIPLSTEPSELLDLDTPTDPTDRAVFDIFKDIPGLPPFLVALAADGVRKARKRRDKAIAEGRWVPGQSKEDGRIAFGLEKAKAEKWVREKIKQGEAILAQRAQAAQAQGMGGGMGVQPMQGVQVGGKL